MQTILTIGILVFGLHSALLAQKSQSPYAGQEAQPLAALSPQEIDGFLSGAGMGFAKVAELNHYPGPKHVLELQEDLQLSQEQLQKTKEIFEAMHQEAVRLGKMYVEKEKELQHLFVNQKIEEDQLQSALTDLAVLLGKIRFTHIHAHLQMKQILSQSQIKNYMRLRGY